MVDDSQIPVDRLPTYYESLEILCPLCSAQVPVRGLRAKRAVDGCKNEWQLIFTCPGCGLVTPFRADKAVARQTHHSRIETLFKRLFGIR